MQMHVCAQRRTKPLHKWHPTAAGWFRRACARSRCDALHFSHRDPRHPVQAAYINLQNVAQALRKYYHPLPHGHRRQHKIHPVCSRLHHAPCVASQSHPTTIARIRNQNILAAHLTARPRKPVRYTPHSEHLHRSRTTTTKLNQKRAAFPRRRHKSAMHNVIQPLQIPLINKHINESCLCAICVSLRRDSRQLLTYCSTAQVNNLRLKRRQNTRQNPSTLRCFREEHEYSK